MVELLAGAVHVNCEFLAIYQVPAELVTAVGKLTDAAVVVEKSVQLTLLGPPL